MVNQNRVFTLMEKVPSTLVVGSFLFSVTNKLTKQTNNFIATDTSPYPDAYNQFDIEEVVSGSEDLLNGKVNLEPAGEWLYNIYAQASTTNLDPDLADITVETGMFRVVGGVDSAEYTEYSGQDDQTNYYSPAQ